MKEKPQMTGSICEPESSKYKIIIVVDKMGAAHLFSDKRKSIYILFRPPPPQKKKKKKKKIPPTHTHTNTHV